MAKTNYVSLEPIGALIQKRIDQLEEFQSENRKTLNVRQKIKLKKAIGGLKFLLTFTQGLCDFKFEILSAAEKKAARLWFIPGP